MANLTGKTMINTDNGVMTVRESVECGTCDVITLYYLYHDEAYGNMTGSSPRWKKGNTFHRSLEEAQKRMANDNSTKIVISHELREVSTQRHYSGALSDYSARSLLTA